MGRTAALSIDWEVAMVEGVGVGVGGGVGIVGEGEGVGVVAGVGVVEGIEGIEGNVAGVGAQNDRACWKHWH